MRPSDRKLATALAEAGLIELTTRAEAGEFNEFFGPHATPELLLASLLRVIGTKEALAVRARLIEGEFDAGSDESEEWARSPEGRDVMESLVNPKRKPGDVR